MCCLCSQHQWWPWKSTIPGLFIQFPGDGLVCWWCPVAALCSWLLECPHRVAGDLFTCQADAFIMRIILSNLHFTCVLHQSGLLQCEVCFTHQHFQTPGMFSPYSLLLISFNRFSRKVKQSGVFSSFFVLLNLLDGQIALIQIYCDRKRSSYLKHFPDI